MNRITFKHAKINGGKRTFFYTSANKYQTQVQIQEVLIQQHYRMGKIKKNMTIIDCGANIGLASLYFKDWAKVIYSLEPSSKNFECLLENTSLYKNIKPFMVGLAAGTSYEWLKTNGDSPVGESLFGDGPPIEQVKLFSIEEFMNAKEIKHVDLLKIDTEGAEYIILPSEAFGRMAPKIDYIIGEAHYFNTLIPEYIPLILSDHGYDTKFLPIHNIWLSLNWDEGVKKTYKVEKQTIFFAKRKDLPWPKS